MSTKEFPDGIRVFKPNDKAPSFIKGNISIKKSELINWLQSQGEEVKLNIKESQKGTYYLEVDTYKREAKPANQEITGDLPF
jgi:hypothetical protein